MEKIWPLGCKKVKSEEELNKLLRNNNYVAQRKIDGVRGILHIMEDGSMRFTTRGASIDDPSTPIEITHRLEHLQLRCPTLRDSIFDGEFYCPKYTSAEVSGMINYRSTVDVDPEITLYIFDILKIRNISLIDTSFMSRMAILSKVQPTLEKRGFVIVPFVEGYYEKNKLFHQELEAGREGIVLKNTTVKYRLGRSSQDNNKPSNTWYKAKKKDTLDVRIIGSKFPEQYYTDPTTGKIDETRVTKPWEMGWFGSLVFEFIDRKGKRYIGACSGMTDDMKQLLSDGHHKVRREYLKRWMEVEYMEKTSDGNLRHPRFIRIREEIEK